MNLLPHIFQNGWMTLPIEIIRAFNGRSRLPVYKCEESDVRKGSGRVPISTAPDFSFSAWRLAHAVKKADCARWPSSRILWPRVAGFLLENVHLFDWNSTEIRLSSGMSDFYTDFSRTSLSGRIGQGMALLFLEDRRYSYVGRFSTVLDRYGLGSKTSGKARGKSKRSPDFVVENKQREWALAESKGSFVSPGKYPERKKILKEALDQLDGWDGCFSPQSHKSSHKSFAIGTFLRETGDRRNKSSCMAYVETELEKSQSPVVKLPQDSIRRANYASWLSLMGFDDAARRLRVRTGESEQRTVPLLTLGGNKYVVAITSIRPSYRHHAHDPDFLRPIWEGLDWLFGILRDGVAIEIIGLDLDVVRKLEATFQDAEALMGIESREPRDIPVEFEGGEFHGSVFSDGSLFGEVRISDMDWSGIESIKVVL